MSVGSRQGNQLSKPKPKDMGQKSGYATTDYDDEEYTMWPSFSNERPSELNTMYQQTVKTTQVDEEETRISLLAEAQTKAAECTYQDIKVSQTIDRSRQTKYFEVPNVETTVRMERQAYQQTKKTREKPDLPVGIKSAKRAHTRLSPEITQETALRKRWRQMSTLMVSLRREKRTQDRILWKKKNFWIIKEEPDQQKTEHTNYFRWCLSPQGRSNTEPTLKFGRSHPSMIDERKSNRGCYKTGNQWSSKSSQPEKRIYLPKRHQADPVPKVLPEPAMTLRQLPLTKTQQADLLPNVFLERSDASLLFKNSSTMKQHTFFRDHDDLLKQDFTYNCRQYTKEAKENTDFRNECQIWNENRELEDFNKLSTLWKMSPQSVVEKNLAKMKNAESAKPHSKPENTVHEGPKPKITAETDIKSDISSYHTKCLSANMQKKHWLHCL